MGIIKKRTKYFKLVKGESDFSILLLTIILVLIGIVSVFSASFYTSINTSGSPYSVLQRHLAYVFIGLVTMLVAAKLDYHHWKSFNLFLVPGTLIGLIALFFIGTTVNGATRWIIIGPLSIMPGEIAKLTMIVFVATFLAANPKRAKNFFGGIVPVGILTVLFGALIMAQPNMSIAVTIVAVVAMMLYVAGLPKIYLTGVGASIVAGFILLVATDPHGYRLRRITGFLDPFANSLGDAFQVVQSLLALGSGGLFGLGIGKSVQKTLYLPEPHNDFVLAIIGEEVGFVGIGVLMLCYMLLIWRGVRVAMNAPDTFGMLLATGIVGLLAFQVIVNVGVVTSSFPVTGITLPFVSYGGNALIIFMTSIGILLNISKKRTTVRKES